MCLHRYFRRTDNNPTSMPALFIFIRKNMFKVSSVVRFQVFTAVMFQVAVFWAVTPCSVVLGYHTAWKYHQFVGKLRLTDYHRVQTSPRNQFALFLSAHSDE
jgi:hypothetical protein